MNSDPRAGVLSRVAAAVPVRDEPVRVAVDGVDGAGKSVFAEQLAEVVRASGRPVVHASVDDFHRPRAERYRRGRESPEGFWLEAFDYEQLRSELLDPLGPGGSRSFRTAVHDLVTDRVLDSERQIAGAGTVLVLDGLFLHRDELRDCWDLSVFLEVPFEVTAARMASRDGSVADPGHPSMRRYVRAQQLYFESCRPRERASVVIDNSDWDNPVIRT